MQTLALTNAEAAATGFTHKAIITSADLTTAGGTQTIVLRAMAAGEILRNMGRKIVTNFSGGSATALTTQVGDGSTANLYQVAQSVLGSNSPVTYQTGDGTGFNQGSAVVQAATNLTVTFTATGANVNTVTAGEVHFYYGIASLPNT